MRLDVIAQIIQATISKKSNFLEREYDISHLLTDSRKLVTNPLHTLFIGLKTAKDDGANYVCDLIQKGVRAFVINQSSFQQISDKIESLGDAYCIMLVPNSLEALQQLAIYKRQNFNGIVIGITGSNGKTALKEMLYDLLKNDFTVIRSPKSYNSQIGVPLSVWQLPETKAMRPTIGIFEVGISKPGEMAKLEPIVRPTIGIITNIGYKHSENFLTQEDILKEKKILFKRSRIILEDTYHQNVRICERLMQELGYGLDVINDRIATQTHETKLLINLSALVANLRYFRSLLAPTTRMICMVKAFAYGIGSVQVSKVLQEATYKNLPLVQYLAVAIADEAIELRKEGITLPIIVMNPEASAIRQIIGNNLEPSLYSFDILKAFLSCAEQMGISDYPVHIKIDSGMHRLGFYIEELPQLAEILHKRRNGKLILQVRSVFSHLACADDKKWDDFTLRQISYFEKTHELLQSLLGYSVFRHICNSAGTERFPQYAQEACRIGIGMYGFSVIKPHLNIVCNLITTIISVKTVKAGEYIGYNAKTQLYRDSQIAVIPIGYADGLDRRLSNYFGQVIVRQKKCPIVGNICMDQAMVDITDTDATIGDQVIIFGDHLPLTQLCKKLHTIPYEILTSLSRRVTRDYYYE